MKKSSKYMDRALRSRDPRHARILAKLGYEGTPVKARPAPTPPMQSSGYSSYGAYATRATGIELDEPEDVAVTAAGAPDEKSGKKRHYKRRDLQSED